MNYAGYKMSQAEADKAVATGESPLKKFKRVWDKRGRPRNQKFPGNHGTASLRNDKDPYR
jgi:hypothetical protein